jgi:hypothetical protein
VSSDFQTYAHYTIKPLVWELDFLGRPTLQRFNIFIQPYGPKNNPTRVEVLEIVEGEEEYWDEAKTIEEAKTLAEKIALDKILVHLEEVK